MPGGVQNVPLLFYLRRVIFLYLVIAEKPSVAHSIGEVLGATEKKSGYLAGTGCLVTWCIGHLVELAQPHVYDERYAKWKWDDLPILPEEWRYNVSLHTRKQFDIIRKLMNEPQVDTIVCATDAGREGELIFRLVYRQCGCIKPIKRLWISSLEESAIRTGFDNLHDGCEYESLYQAALCRQQADWLVGINASRIFSLLYNATLNVGRVMSPTLALIVSREAAIAAFQPELFYTVQMSCGFLASTERMSEKAEAQRIQELCNLNTAVVKNIEKKRKKEKPPKLYDLTSLQRYANRLFGFTAQQTLDYVQSLYEKKLLTYPRTDSRYLTSDMAGYLPELVNKVAAKFPFTAGLHLTTNPNQVIDNSKVTDHHAIIPTRSMMERDLLSLPIGERDLLQLVSVRLLCAVGETHVYDETIITLECEGVTFKAKGKNVVQMGWKIPEATFLGSVGERIQKENPDREYPIPELEVGQPLSPVMTKIKEGRTSPPKHFTEDTLLAAMESAGAEDMPEDAERKGLGTSATRAETVEKLISTGYIVRKGEKRAKYLLPTAKGTALITVLPEQLQSPLLTAEWEQQLKQIEYGEIDPKEFMREIQDMLTELVQTAKPVPGADMLFSSERKSLGACPLCGVAVTEKKNGFFCENQTCRFGIWKDNRFFADKDLQLTPAIITALLKNGRVRVKGLRSQKSGKAYDAAVVMEMKDGSPRFRLEFDSKAH